MDYRFTIRITVVFAAVLLVFGIFVGRLYKVQVSQDVAVVGGTDTYEFYSTVSAARGNLLDRNGKVLIGNRASYNLSINNFIIYSKQSTNNNIRNLLHQCEVYEIEWADHFPVSLEAPFVSRFGELDGNWQNRFKKFMEERDWDVDMTVSSLIRQLRSSYNIPEDWSDEDARKVIGIRYELELRSYDFSLSSYILAYDVSSDALAALIELNVPGVNVETTTVREYETSYAAHILGTVGKMTAEEYAKYQELGYSMDAVVGKDGFEYAFEEYLHGIDGRLCTVMAPDGTVVEEYYTKEPQAGSNVELTIDIGLQKVGEDALAAYIQKLRSTAGSTIQLEDSANGNGSDAEGGAFVMMKCKTGEVLACGSYPTFDLSTFSEDFESLLEQDYAPLYNRATQAIYYPGSTYKMVTCIAAVDFLQMDPHMGVYDEGRYMRYADQGFTPGCMVYRHTGATHGQLEMRTALAASCNYYFYVLGDQIYYADNSSFDHVNEIAQALGLGVPTGAELPESTGYNASAETKRALSGDSTMGFYAADALLASIGQSENKFTVLQLATYCSTLANKGTRYRTTFLQRAVSADYSKLVAELRPQVMSQLEISDAAMSAIHDGMYWCATNPSYGTAARYFRDYPVAVCAKTGTADQDGAGSANAAFVCYAPADDPEVAIAIYVEKGGGGSGLSPIAIELLNAYFAEDDPSRELGYAEGMPY